MKNQDFLKFNGNSLEQDWYTIQLPGKETTFVVPEGSSARAVFAKVKRVLKAYADGPHDSAK